MLPSDCDLEPRDGSDNCFSYSVMRRTPIFLWHGRYEGLRTSDQSRDVIADDSLPIRRAHASIRAEHRRCRSRHPLPNLLSNDDNRLALPDPTTHVEISACRRQDGRAGKSVPTAALLDAGSEHVRHSRTATANFRAYRTWTLCLPLMNGP
jgi:hypothetical protein